MREQAERARQARAADAHPVSSAARSVTLFTTTSCAGSMPVLLVRMDSAEAVPTFDVWIMDLGKIFAFGKDSFYQGKERGGDIY